MRDSISIAMNRRWCLGVGFASLLAPLSASATQGHFRFWLPDGLKAPSSPQYTMPGSSPWCATP